MRARAVLSLAGRPVRALAVVLAAAAALAGVPLLAAPAQAAITAVTLTATPTADNRIQLAATADADVAASPSTLSIYDVTTGALLGSCRSNCRNRSELTVITVPTATTAQLSMVAHQYVAVVGAAAASYPPATVVAQSPAVTADRWDVSLTAAANDDGTFSLTATTNYRVPGSGYTLSIFDTTTGARVGACSGNCTGGTRLTSKLVPTGSTTAVSSVPHQYVAVVANAGPTYRPDNLAVESVLVPRDRWEVTLTGTTAGGQYTLTATSSYRVTGSPYVLSIFDLTAGTRVASCQSGCAGGRTVTVSLVPSAGSGDPSAATHRYIAVVGDGATSYPAGNVADESAEVTSDSWQVSLAKAGTDDGRVTLTATSSYRVTGSPYVLSIFDVTTGARVGFCQANCADGRTASTTLVPTASTTALSGAEHRYVAVVGDDSTTYPPGNRAAVSPEVTLAWSVSLAAATVAGATTLTATPNYRISGSGYVLGILSLATGARVASCQASCADGRTLTWSPAPDQLGDSFVAYVADDRATAPPDNVAARSAPVTPVPVGATPAELVGGCPAGGMLDCAANAGAPVDLDSGAFVHAQTDLTVPGRGPALDLTRSYDTRAAAVAGRLGFGWTDSYDLALRVDTSATARAGQVTVRQPNGAKAVFSPDGQGGYVAPARILAALAHDADGGWTYTVRRGTRYGFDAAGRLTAIRDGDDLATSLAYDAAGRLATVTDPAGRTLTFGYDEAGRVTSVTDPLPRVVRYGYDAAGDLASVTDADGRAWSFGYDAAHRLLTATDPRGSILATAYDATGRVAAQTGPGGGRTTFSYGLVSAGSHTTTVTGPRGGADVYTWTNRRLVAVDRGSGAAAETRDYDPRTNALTGLSTAPGRVTTWTYDEHADRLTGTDPLDRTTRWSYDDHGRPLTETGPDGVTTTRSYDRGGNLLAVSRPLTGSDRVATTRYARGDDAHPGDITAETDPRGGTTTYEYDRNGYRTGVTDPTGRRTTSRYNEVGWLTSTVSAAGNAEGGDPDAWRTAYAAFTGFGRPGTVTDPLGHVTTYGYDATQNLTDVTDADGRRTRTGFDGAARPVLVTGPDGSTRATAYDPDGNVTGRTEAGRTTTYGYDALDRPVREEDAAGRVTTRSYDAAGNLRTLVEPGDHTTTFDHDAAGRLTGIGYDGGAVPDVRLTYDAAGNRATMTDGTGTTTYATDSLGRLTAVTNGAGRTLSYGYDLGGDATAITDGDSGTVARGFDAAGRLVSVQDGLSGTPTTFGYDADGRWQSTTTPNGVIGTRDHDRADRLTGISYARSGTDLGGWAYARTGAGLLSAGTPAAGAPGTPADYAYDAAGRLVSATGPDTTATWQYDEAGRLAADPAGTRFGYEATDRLTTATPAEGAATGYGYDARGDRTSATTGTGPATTSEYERAGRMIRWTGPDGRSVSYGYDGDGLRTSRTPAGGAAEPAVWDAVTAAVPLLLADGGTSYLYGPDGTPVEQITDGTASYLHPDGLGSVGLVTDAAGEVAGRYAYDPYGTATFTGTLGSRLGFAGGWTDPVSGLVELRGRWYDPASAQFLTPAAGAPRYLYGGGNPLS